MELLAKAAAAALTAAVVGLILKKNVPELGFVLTLTAAAMALLLAATRPELIGKLLLTARVGQSVRGAVMLAADATGLSAAVLAPVMKCVGIGVLTRLTADLCADAGQSAAGSAVEICGAVCALVAALPLMESFFAMIDGML